MIRSFEEAVRFAAIAHKSGLLPKAVDTPEKATVILLKGLELGFSPMQSFAVVNVIQGKAEVAAEGLIAKCVQSPACKYFRLVESTDKVATFETHRAGHKSATTHSFTIEDAARLELAGKDNWKKQPRTMLRWRCASALAKMVYPDLVLGLYVQGEVAESVTLEEVPAHERMSAAPAAAPSKPEPDKFTLEGALAEVKAAKTIPELDALAKKLGGVRWNKSERATVAGAFTEKRKALAPALPPKSEDGPCAECGTDGGHVPACPLGPAAEREPGAEG
jgi:hypothetical protein